MAFVGASDAKTHLAELLDRVTRGEKITITRHGVPAAMLVPVGETSARMTHREIVEGIRKLRKRIKPGKMNVRWWKRGGGFDRDCYRCVRGARLVLSR
jgi:prevent-host-death family protein